MELDWTTQLRPALWGLIILLVASATALIAVADREEVDLMWRHRPLFEEVRRRLHLVRAFGERLLARVTTLMNRGERLSRQR
jgi:hypothetical protein